MRTSVVVRAWLVFVASLVNACSRSSNVTESSVQLSPAPAATELPQRSVERALSARNALDLPASALTAEAGQFALVPTPRSIEALLERGIDEHTFVYSGATIEQVGPELTSVRFTTEQRALLPNAFIIPIRPRERAVASDIVLTKWASGSGLARAIVVSGGAPASPKVRYLDLGLENPNSPETEEDVLPANSFHVLRAPGDIGSTFACKIDDRVEPIVLIHRVSDRLLGLGFAGAVRLVGAERCQPLPLAPQFRAGDRVFAPVVGRFTEGKVTRVESLIGRVWVRHQFAAETDERSFGFTNLAIELPQVRRATRR